MTSTKLIIKLKQNIYWTGEVIEGDIIMPSFGYPYKSALKVEFIGVGETVNIIKKKDWLEKFYCKDLLEFNGEVSERNHIIPFKCALPNDLPNSFFSQLVRHDFFTWNESFAVRYCVNATLKVPHQPEQQSHEVVVVQERQKEIAAPICLREIDRLGVSIWLDRNIYFPGDRIIARLKLINNLETATSGPTLNMRLEHMVEFKPRVLREALYTVVIAPPPIQYYGIVWMSFNLPQVLPLSSNGAPAISLYFLKFEFEYGGKISIPITILERQELRSLHPIAPPDAILPPTICLRPPLQNDCEVSSCNLCKTKFGFLRGKIHCRHCGKIFCWECSNVNTSIEKLKYHSPVRVCRPCARVIGETGGVKYQKCKQVLEEWSKSPGVQWVPLCSKKSFNWTQVQNYAEGRCFGALSVANV